MAKSYKVSTNLVFAQLGGSHTSNEPSVTMAHKAFFSASQQAAAWLPKAAAWACKKCRSKPAAEV